MTSSYATIVGVLPPSRTFTGSTSTSTKIHMTQGRVYVPRTSRPHVAWGGYVGSEQDSVSEDEAREGSITSGSSYKSKNQMWTLLGQRYGGTYADTDADDSAQAVLRQRHPRRDNARNQDSTADYGLTQLVTVDARTGLQAMCYRSAAHRVVTTSSTPIPSRRRIVSVLPVQPHTSSPVALYPTPSNNDNHRGVVQLYVSDDVGNVYTLDLSTPQLDDDASLCSSPVHKRARLDTAGRHDSTNEDQGNDQDNRQRSSSAGRVGVSSWRLLAPSCSALSPSLSHGAQTSVHAHDWLSSLCATSLGAPGWAGLAVLSTDQYTNTITAATPAATFESGNDSASVGATDHPWTQLVSARQYFHDVRLLDLASASVVRTYSTIHSPTGVWQPRGQPHCVMVTAGCLATLYDLRCPSAALTLAEVHQSVEEMRTCNDCATTTAASAKTQSSADSMPPTHAMTSHGERTHRGSGATGKHTCVVLDPPQRHDTARGNESCHNSDNSEDAALSSAVAQRSKHCGTSSVCGLVMARLTSRAGCVADGCNTAREYEVALAVDRALQVYDYRKFTRVYTASSVLKYTIGSVAPAAGGRAIVCAGIDSEMRTIALPVIENNKFRSNSTSHCSAGKHVLGANATVSTNALGDCAKGQTNMSEKNGHAASPGASALASSSDAFAVSTFRTRLNTSINCQTTWSGGWVSSCNDDGRLAVGISATNELYFVQ